MNKTSIHLKRKKERGYKISTNYSNLIRMWAHSFPQLLPEGMWFSSCVDEETLNTVSPSHKNTFCLHSDSRNRTKEAAFTQEIFVTIESRCRWGQHGFTCKPVEMPPSTLLQPAGTVPSQRLAKVSKAFRHNRVLTTHSKLTARLNPGCHCHFRCCRLCFPECNPCPIKPFYTESPKYVQHGLWSNAKAQEKNRNVLRTPQVPP